MQLGEHMELLHENFQLLMVDLGVKFLLLLSQADALLVGQACLCDDRLPVLVQSTALLHFEPVGGAHLMQLLHCEDKEYR